MRRTSIESIRLSAPRLFSVHSRPVIQLRSRELVEADLAQASMTMRTLDGAIIRSRLSNLALVNPSPVRDVQPNYYALNTNGRPERTHIHGIQLRRAGTLLSNAA